MTFEEWWTQRETVAGCALKGADNASAAYEAGIQEGIDRMYRLYDICPECGLPNGQHKMDCSRG
jgi:hypothetical protein